MEHAQRVNQLKFNSNMKNVLILILMEHAQRGGKESYFQWHSDVLILILMEHAQRVMPINSLVSILKVLS